MLCIVGGFHAETNLCLQTALFASWFSFGLPSIFWLFMNKGKYFVSAKKIGLTVVNLLIIGMACVLVRAIVFLCGCSIADR